MPQDSNPQDRHDIQNVRRGVESEIGKNGWKLVGKVFVAVIIPLVIQAVAIGVWVGATTSQMTHNVAAISANSAAIAKMIDQQWVQERNAASQEATLKALQQSVNEIMRELRAFRREGRNEP